MAFFQHKRFDDLEPQPPFFRLNQDDLDALHESLKEILFDIVGFCDANDITYFLVFGSCLGAVRNEGIIPWDDDIDVAMAREDLDRFIPLFDSCMSDKYSLVVPGKTKGYSRTIYKVRKRGTRLGNFEDDDLDNRGVFIDIFVLENVPDSRVGRAIHGAGSVALRACAYFRRIFEWGDWHLRLAANDEEMIRDIKRRIMIGKLLSFAPVEAWALWSDKWNSRFKHKRTKKIAFTSAVRSYFYSTYDYNDFFPPSSMSFEGQKLSIPAHYDFHLRKCFGDDYLSIPENDQRISHIYLSFDLGNREEPAGLRSPSMGSGFLQLE